MVVCVGSGGNIIGQRDLKKTKKKNENGKTKVQKRSEREKRTKNMGTSVRKMTGEKLAKESRERELARFEGVAKKRVRFHV